MASLLSSLVNKFAEGIHEIKCKYGYDDKACKKFGIKYKDWGCCLEYTSFKDYLIVYDCLLCKKSTKKCFVKT